MVEEKGEKIHALHKRKRFDERSVTAQGRTLERQGSKFLRILPRFDGNNQSGFVVLSCCFLQKHFKYLGEEEMSLPKPRWNIQAWFSGLSAEGKRVGGYTKGICASSESPGAGARSCSP